MAHGGVGVDDLGVCLAANTRAAREVDFFLALALLGGSMQVRLRAGAGQEEALWLQGVSLGLHVSNISDFHGKLRRHFQERRVEV